MRAAVALRDVIGEALRGFLIGIIPLHGDFDNDAVFFAGGVKDGLVQHAFTAIHVFDKTLDAAAVGEILFLAGALISHDDFDAVIQERQFAQAARQDVVMKLDFAEHFGARHEMHFGTTAFAFSRGFERSNSGAVAKFHLMHFAVAADGEAQPFG